MDAAGDEGIAATPPRIGALLVEKGLITPAQREEALQLARRWNVRFGEVLVAMGWIKSRDLYRTLAAHVGVPFVDLSAQPPDGALLDPADAALYMERLTMPWRREANGRLTIATADPGAETSDFVRGKWGDDVDLVVTAKFDVIWTTQRVFEAHLSHEAVHSLAERDPVMSAKRIVTAPQLVFLYALLSALLLGLARAPVATLIAANTIIGLWYLGNFIFKGLLVWFSEASTSGGEGETDMAMGIGVNAWIWTSPFTTQDGPEGLGLLDKAKQIDRAKLSLDELHQRARQTAFLVPGLTIVVRDERPGATAEGEAAAPAEEVFHYDGGIGEFCEFLAPDKPICDVLRLQGEGTFKETVPVLDERGHMTPTEVTRDLGVDVALRWGTGYDSTVRSFVNIISTPKGGTHVAGFERALTRTLNEVLRSSKLLRVAEDDVVKDDAMEGLTAVVTVRLAEPQFEGQTKEVLGTSAASRIVANVVSKELKAFLTSTRRDDRQQARTVMEKVVAAARTRIAARQHKEAQRRKTALESSSLPAKLADCRSDDVERTELFIVEGDSALGTAKVARNSEFQALLPIRGKILNVQKSSVSDMLKNAECGAIIQVIGAGSGRTFDIDQARYGKVIFLADADVDGAHIRCLLLTLFQRYMRPMVEEGRVFSAVPPLHRIELVNPKKGQDKYLYTYSDNELRQTLLDLERRKVRYKDAVQRYKGLGEMDADQLAETTMDPRHRTLRRINISDLEAAERAFDLLMGNEVAPRKEFISSSAAMLDRSSIDV